MNRPNGRVRRRVAVGLAIACALVCVSAVSAWAGTITTPADNFNVPDAGGGTPDFFTVRASGMPASTPIFVEICDGVPSTALNWSPADHCDSASGQAPAFSDASGNVSFLASDANRRLLPFKGESPQSLFNCNASHDTPPSNLLDDFTNCQVRVATSTANVTTDQAFVTINLPNVPEATTTSTSTTVPVATNPTCGMGAGTATQPGRPNKNVGTIKVSPGALQPASPKAKKTTLGIAGTLENCTNMDGVPSKYPISSGAMKAQVQVGPGTACDALIGTTPVKTKLTLTWKGINPKTNKPATAASTDNTTLTVVAELTGSNRGFDIVSAPFAGSKSAFTGKHAEMHIVVDQNAGAIASQCAAKGGLKLLNFTGVRGASTITIKP